MQKSKLGLHNPIDMIYYMQPWMILSLLPFGIIFEFKTVWEHIDTLFDMKPYDLFMLWLKISIGAFLAFFMEISEFLVLAHTSSLTLSVAGIFKVLFRSFVEIPFLKSAFSGNLSVGISC